MSVQAVNDSQAWGEFLKAAQVARSRNAAFTAPVSQAQQAMHARPKVNVATAAQPNALNASYRPASSDREKPVLGTRFDAYA